MYVNINSKIKLSPPPEKLRDHLIGLLTHENPLFTQAERMGYNTYSIDSSIEFYKFDGAGNMFIPRGMRNELFGLLKNLGIKSTVNDERIIKPFETFIDGSSINFRPYQYPAVSNLLEAGPEGVLVAPAGSGKTVMGLSLVSILQQSTIWLTHTDRLFKQCKDRILEFIPEIKEEDIGLIGGGKWSTGNAITIAMIPTLVQNIPKMNEIKDNFGMVILDECHHCPSRTFTEVVTSLNPYYMYGLTATPYRRDGLEGLLFQCMGPITSTIDKNVVIRDKGIVKPLIVYCGLNFGPRVDISNINIILRSFIIENQDRNERITNDVVNEAKKDNYCIVVSGRKKHCDILYEMILSKWPKTGIATGTLSKKLVDEQVEKFNEKEITVLVTTPELLGEGFDVDFLNRLFIATSFRTEARTEQLVGRIQRFHPDKKDALVYDYVDENIGVLNNQYFSILGNCRSHVYRRLGLRTIDYNEL